MKTLVIFCIILSSYFNMANSQVFTTNRNPVGLEHNILFNATSRYTVTETPAGNLNLYQLFDGNLTPTYSNTAGQTVILIENLPNVHIQAGAWIGWTTRYWPANRFKVEAYDVYYGNGWVVVSDYSNTDYSGFDFSVALPQGSYTKIRITIYSGTGDGGRFGISELYFIHPEATTPYAGLFGSASSSWSSNNNNIYYNTGNVGIGTTSPNSKLVISDNGDNAISLNADIVSGLGFNRNVKDGAIFNSSISAWQFSSRDDRFTLEGYNGPPHDLLTVLKNGNVLIGKITQNNPSYLLDVAGKVRANEVVVNTIGADYVFDSNYKLRKLNDVEQFIKQNKHLPGIAPAKTMQDSGVNLSEMQNKLLQKVEELTLYMIDLKKENEVLKAEIENLKNK
jgi:hypothetical protein